MSAYVIIRQHNELHRRTNHLRTSASVSIHQHTSAYVSIRTCSGSKLAKKSATIEVLPLPDAPCSIKGCPALYSCAMPCCSAMLCCENTSVSIRPHTSAYVSIRQHTSAYVRIRPHTSACVSRRAHAFRRLKVLSFVRQHTSAYVSIRPHTSVYVSIRPHTR